MVLGTRYWCLLEIGVNIICLGIVKYKKQEKFSSTSTEYLLPNTSSIEFDSIGVMCRWNLNSECIPFDIQSDPTTSSQHSESG